MPLSPYRRNPAQSVSESMLSIFMNNMASSIHWKKMNFKWVGFTEQKTEIETEDIKGIVYLSYLFVVYFLQLFFSTFFFFFLFINCFWLALLWYSEQATVKFAKGQLTF